MTIVATSLKMYFDHARTLAYLERVTEIARADADVVAGRLRVAVLPNHLSIPTSQGIVAGSPVVLGAQDLCQADRGPFTGEVSGTDLAGFGVRVVEIGHAERRTIYKEDDELIAAKVQAALRNGLIPLLCIGEPERIDPDEAAALCVAQVRAAIPGGTDAEVWLGYEPYWAIGAPQPAPAAHVTAVCDGIRAGLGAELTNLHVLYGGSAGPGTLASLGSHVDGVFLGRFAHDPEALLAILDEARARA